MSEKQMEKQEELFKINLNSYEGNEPYIFISYSHADSAQVYEVLKLIDREKYRF